MKAESALQHDQPQLRMQFEALLDTDPSERPMKLRELAAGDLDLERRLAELLRAFDASEGFLAAPIVSLSPLLQDAVPMECAGETIDRYQLVAPIGSGSFSVVWLGNQLAPMRREVALKIVKPGLDVRTIAQRFDAERDALARLEHPGISRIYDAGIHRSGRPYFVMELVRGEPITRFVSAHARASRDVASLMIDVCSAVSFAHGQGLIHRDLKPANILVQRVDHKSLPKLIDFGIARILTPDRTSTQTLAVIPSGTPAYMSPEQSTFGEIDGRADVYSLGVVLLELLTGDAMPHDRSPRAVEAAILSKSLDRHWVAVVQRAIATNPDERYDSPDQLSVDLQRIVDGRKPLAPRRSLSRVRRIAIAAAMMLVGVLGWIFINRTPPIVTTPANVAWPVPTAMKQAWRIQPEGNAGWWSVEIDAEARRVFAITSTRDLLEIDLDSGEILRTIRPEGRDVLQAKLNADRSSIILITEEHQSRDQHIVIVDLDSLIRRQWAIRGYVYGMCLLDAEGKRIAVSSKRDGESRIDIYDTDNGSIITTGPIWKSEFAPVYLLSGRGGQGIFTVEPAGRFVEINARTGATVAVIAEANPSTFALNRIDETRVAVTGHYGLDVYDLTERKLVQRLSSPTPTISAALAVDRQSICVGTLDHRVITYHPATGVPMRSLDLGGDPSLVEMPHFLSDGSIIVASQDGSLRRLDLSVE